MMMMMLQRSITVGDYVTGPPTTLPFITKPIQAYPGVNQARERWHLRCWSAIVSNTLKGVSTRRINPGCGESAFPLGL